MGDGDSDGGNVMKLRENHHQQKKSINLLKRKITKVLKKNLLGDFTIYLFGSRARGLAKENSDFDILITTEKHLNNTEKFYLMRNIRKEIKYLVMEIDVVIKSLYEYEKEKELFGGLINEIEQETIIL